MVPPTRRQTILAAGASVAALAGCGADDTSESATTVGSNPSEHVATDPERYTLRRSGDGELVTGAEGERVDRRTAVTDAERAASLAFADVDGADAARAFVRKTEFASETLLVYQSSVRTCYERELCYVSWSEDEVSLRYGRTLRSWDTHCEIGASDAGLWLVRIPAALDGVSSFTLELSSGACRLPPHLRATGGKGSAPSEADRTNDSEGAR